MCGEASSVRTPVIRVTGPSPRVRGSPFPTTMTAPCPGSIPACAGKPGRAGDALLGAGVHPRVCGEAESAAEGRASSAGPSPRVRGSLEQVERPRKHLGSIPACAGKPSVHCGRSHPGRVHPRVCGEAFDAHLERLVEVGPSPRVRGSHHRPLPVARRAGSIPACAGKPLRGRTSRASARVHPRVCGEAASIRGRWGALGGPSPRVRGSPRGGRDPRAVVGSIPACAGKPSSDRPPRLGRWVHPRVCGEAYDMECACADWLGPSPRVRGSPEQEQVTWT